MGEKFLEVLAARADEMGEKKIDHDHNMVTGLSIGIGSAIEALEEMVVGELVRAVVVHETIGSMEFTSIFRMDCRDYDEEEPMAVFGGHCGVDGEEVAVGVFGHQRGK